MKKHTGRNHQGTQSAAQRTQRRSFTLRVLCDVLRVLRGENFFVVKQKPPRDTKCGTKRQRRSITLRALSDILGALRGETGTTKGHKVQHKELKGGVLPFVSFAMSFVSFVVKNSSW